MASYLQANSDKQKLLLYTEKLLNTRADIEDMREIIENIDYILSCYNCGFSELHTCDLNDAKDAILQATVNDKNSLLALRYAVRCFAIELC